MRKPCVGADASSGIAITARDFLPSSYWRDSLPLAALSYPDANLGAEISLSVRSEQSVDSDFADMVREGKGNAW